MKITIELPDEGCNGTVKPTIKWVAVDGGLPRGIDLSDRAAMHDWLRGQIR